MSAKIVQRPAYLKRALFKFGNRKDPPTPLPLEKMLVQVRTATPNGWKDRHYPPRPAGLVLPPGTQCGYVNKISARTKENGGGVYFTVGSYVFGKGEHQIALDMTSEEPDVQSGPIYDAAGKQRTDLHEFHCVALGETLIVQSEKGGGGLPVLRSLLTYLFRLHVDKTLPAINFVDVLSTELRNLLLSEGGVEAMEVKMIGPGEPADNAAAAAISAPLYHAYAAVPGAGKVATVFTANEGGEIDLDVAIDAYEAAGEEGSEVDAVRLKTVRGGWINLGKYRAKGSLNITVDAHGIEHFSDFKPGLYGYLDDLRIAKSKDNWRLINDDGYFLSGKSLNLTTKK